MFWHEWDTRAIGVVQNAQGQIEYYQTTEEHPFHVTDIGWLKASLLEKGMKLLDSQGKPSLEVVSQQALNKTETVYNFEVEAFHTYHIGEFGVWVHNDKCCDLLPKPKSASERRSSPGSAYGATQGLKEIKLGERWLDDNNFSTFPKQIADRMFGRKYQNFDEFRNDFWKEVAKDPILSKEFNPQNLKRMSDGKAPFTKQSEQVGERRTFELDHNKEIQDNGLVYDFNNIIIRTPKNHIQKTTDEIIDRKNHDTKK